MNCCFPVLLLIQKRQNMESSGFNPGLARWQTQTDPLNYLQPPHNYSSVIVCTRGGHELSRRCRQWRSLKCTCQRSAQRSIKADEKGYKNQISHSMPPQLSGFVCSFHPATPGSNPKHTVNALINLKFKLCRVEKPK